MPDFIDEKKEKPRLEVPVEREILPERAPEVPPVKKEIPEKPLPPPPPPPVERPKVEEVLPVEKSETRFRIEEILSEGLEEVYLSLPEAQKAEFKKKGEETASKIEKLLESVKIQVKKILDLIRQWLMMIPGVNRFFLEQESKIKTDKILALKEK